MFPRIMACCRAEITASLNPPQDLEPRRIAIILPRIVACRRDNVIAREQFAAGSGTL